MQSQEDIAAQKELLATHRRTLAHLLTQRAQFSAGFVPAHIDNGIQEARGNIARIKKVLHSWGVGVDDLPNDEVDNREGPADSGIRSNRTPQAVAYYASDEKGATFPSTFNRINSVNGWDLSPEDLAVTIPEYSELFQRIARLPASTHEFLSIIVLRGKEEGLPGDISALYQDIVEATCLGENTVYKQVQILELHKFAILDGDEQAMIFLTSLPSGSSIRGELKRFSERINVPLQAILVDLRFGLLD